MGFVEECTNSAKARASAKLHDNLIWSKRSRPRLQLIVCEPEGKNNSHNTISLSKDLFITVLRRFEMPNDFLVTIMTGTPGFKQVQTQESFSSRTHWVMRTPLSRSNNWSLALSYDYSNATTYAMLHGFQAHELIGLLSAMNEFKTSSAHPLLLPVLLCEMLTESDSNEIKRHGSNLFQVEHQTNLIRIGQPNTMHSNDQTVFAEDDLEDITRRLNAIMSRLAFHEMRINANVTLVATIINNFKVLERRCVDLSPDEEDSEPYLMHMKMRRRLQNLQVEQAALLNEIACNQKVAAGQLQIVYNLIAQRDTRENLRVASISTSIAATTKDDSFVMRTVAVMTILFLPTTAISSMFSMSVFDWHAVGGNAVLSRRFWIYWAVVAPLTLVVLTAWLIWIYRHKKREKKHAPELDLPSLSHTKESRRKEKSPGLRRRVQADKKEDLEHNGENLHHARGNASVASFNRIPEPSRAGTIAQGPMR